ncbi:MAG: HAD family hydrolase [Paracoccaceae bacterium]|nr:MAG: HAD family hydrolase [Paracoccaceae bacterium]
MNIAMWSGPRNLSTAMMYAFAARGDCAVWDEPFYAAYLAATGLDHPMGDAILAAGDADPARVAMACANAPATGEKLFYQKHMTHHMIDGFPLDFMDSCTNVFLIRHPVRVIASYVAKRENPTLDDIGFPQQSRLFDRVADRTGRAPLVVDSADIRANPPGILQKLCDSLGIGFTWNMLSWPAGPKPYDGAWAPHWYGAVHRSTGFDTAEGPLPDLPPEFHPLAEAARLHYDRLAPHRLTA